LQDATLPEKKTDKRERSNGKGGNKVTLLFPEQEQNTLPLPDNSEIFIFNTTQDMEL